MKSIFMKKADAEKWLSALRSGKYQKATGSMCQYEDGVLVGYCCLGVLQMELSGEIEHRYEKMALPVPTQLWKDYHGIRFTSDSSNKVNADIPQLDLKYESGVLYTATSYNDVGPKITFNMIADELEKVIEYTDEV